jgi:hypothetical protein
LILTVNSGEIARTYLTVDVTDVGTRALRSTAVTGAFTTGNGTQTLTIQATHNWWGGNIGDILMTVTEIAK